MSTYTFELLCKVRDYECDSQGVVNNANYQHYFEHTRHEFLHMGGTNFQELAAKGINPVVSRVEIDYKTSLRGGDEFYSSLNVTRQGVKFVFHQVIHRLSDGKLCARARIETVCVVDGQLTRGNELEPYFKKYFTTP